MLALTHRTIDFDDWHIHEYGKAHTKRRVYRVNCACGRVSYQQRTDALKDRPCLRCNGRKGWRVTWGRPGKREHLLERIADYQRRKPSGPEQAFAQTLDAAAIAYEQQRVLNLEGRLFLVDFVLVPPAEDSPVLIEINGPFHDPASPVFNPAIAQRDARLEVLAANAGYTLHQVAHDSDFAAFVETYA